MPGTNQTIADGSVVQTAAASSDVADRVAVHIDSLMSIDVAHTCSKTIDGIVRDWGNVSHVELAADRQSLAFLAKDEDDARYTMTARLEIHFTDRAVVERPVIVTVAIDEDTGIGIVSIDTFIG